MYVGHDPGDSVVYVEKPSGGYVAVYVGSAYDYRGGWVVSSDRSEPHSDAVKVFE